MDYVSFLSSEKNSHGYYFEGEDSFLHNRAVNSLKEAFNCSDMDFSFLESDVSENEIISLLETAPFLSEKRIVCVKEFYPKSQEVKKLDEYLQKNDYSVLIVSNTNKCECLKKLPFVVVDCSKNENFVLSYIKKSLKQEGIECGREEAQTICDYCLADSYKIDGELKKLSAFCREKGVVEISDIEKLVTKDDDFKIYELTDHIANKRIKKAYGVLTDMINKNEPPQRLFFSIYNHFKRLFYCRLKPNSIDELVRLFGIKEYAVKKTVSLALKFPAKSLKEILDRFFVYDERIKSGKLDVNEALWLSVFGIVTR